MGHYTKYFTDLATAGDNAQPVSNESDEAADLAVWRDLMGDACNTAEDGTPVDRPVFDVPLPPWNDARLTHVRELAGQGAFREYPEVAVLVGLALAAHDGAL